mgnify:FL=1
MNKPYIAAWICSGVNGIHYGAEIVSAYNEYEAVGKGIAHAQYIHPNDHNHSCVVKLITPDYIQDVMRKG